MLCNSIGREMHVPGRLRIRMRQAGRTHNDWIPSGIVPLDLSAELTHAASDRLRRDKDLGACAGAAFAPFV